MNQQKLILKAFKSGKLQKLILREIICDLPKEERQRFNEESMPDDIIKTINDEIRKQLLEFGISEEQIQEIEK